MSDQNVQLLQGFFEIVNGHDLSQLSEVCPDDYAHHDPQLPVTHIDSLSQYQEVLGGFFEGFPDIRVDIHDVFGAGDRVAARWSFSGSHTGALGELPATNKTVTVNALIISRIAGGKMAESWVVYDCMGMMQQLGVVPGPEGG